MTKGKGLTKADLAGAVYDRHGGLTKGEAAEIVDAIFQTVKSSLVDGRPVKIRNFGVFDVKARKGRSGVNPATGLPIEIPAHRGLAFRPSDGLKAKVDGPAKQRDKE
jgi:integration host factor subunit alpha